MQSGVDDFKASVAKRSCDHLHTAIMAIKPRLGNDYSISTIHVANCRQKFNPMCKHILK
jgi:predicted metal-binding protein